MGKAVLPTSMRLSADVKDALVRAADADGRSVSSLTDRILRAWLGERGYLAAPEGSKVPKPRKRP